MLAGHVAGHNIDQLEITIRVEDAIKIPDTAQIVDITTYALPAVHLKQNAVALVEPTRVKTAADLQPPTGLFLSAARRVVPVSAHLAIQPTNFEMQSVSPVQPRSRDDIGESGHPVAVVHERVRILGGKLKLIALANFGKQPNLGLAHVDPAVQALEIDFFRCRLGVDK